MSHKPLATTNPSCLNRFGLLFGHNDMKVIDTSSIETWLCPAHKGSLACRRVGPSPSNLHRALGITILPLSLIFPICKTRKLSLLVRDGGLWSPELRHTHKTVGKGGFLAWSYHSVEPSDRSPCTSGGLRREKPGLEWGLSPHITGPTEGDLQSPTDAVGSGRRSGVPLFEGKFYHKEGN